MTSEIIEPQVKMPWDCLYPKQKKLFDLGIASVAKDEHPEAPVIILCDGPRKSVKSIAVEHRVMRHLYETAGARFAVIVKNTKSATDGGVLNDFMELIIPLWQQAGMCEFLTFNRDGQPGHITDSKTRTIYFQVRNWWGGMSELRLFSLDHDHQVKEKFKGTRFSGVWMVELANFRDPDVFRTTVMQLRMAHLKPYEHLWIADCNPDSEGVDSWIYKTFFKRAKSDDHKDLAFLRTVRTLTFTLEDNIGMTDAEKEFQRSLYADDEGELQREFYGKWVKGSGQTGKHFADVFIHDVHVIGGKDTEGDRIDILKSTDRLLTGWDIGSGANHAAGIIQKRMVNTPNGECGYFDIIDSIIHTNEQISTGDLGKEMLEKMDDIELKTGRTFDWVHYTDDTALTMFRSSSGTFDYMEIQAATKGRIDNMIGVPKPPHSVHKRVQLIKRLLRQERLFVSARCTEVIDMFNNLRKGSLASDFVQWDENKHVFDWISYVIFMEMIDELEAEIERPRATAEPQTVMQVR